MGEGDEFDLDACLTMEGGCRVGLASRTSLPCPLHSRKASRGRKRTMEGERKEEGVLWSFLILRLRWQIELARRIIKDGKNIIFYSKTNILKDINHDNKK